MLPIVLNVNLRAGLAGAGEGFQRRLEVLKRAGMMAPMVFAGRLPSEDEIRGLSVLFVAGLDAADARFLAETARRLGVLVNVEDVPALCDFHVPAEVRRGDLVLTVSTGGRSPGLSRLLREGLARRFGPEWGERLDELADVRQAWRAEGAEPNEVSQRTRTLLAERGWLE